MPFHPEKGDAPLFTAELFSTFPFHLNNLSPSGFSLWRWHCICKLRVEVSMDSSKKTILVVDDDRLFLWSLDKLLQSEGYDVCPVDTWESALDLIRQRSFDLVISDFQLPGLNGKDLIRKIKGLHPETKTLLISAYQPEEFGSEESALLNAYLNKPIELGMLRKLVAELIHSCVENSA
jgi:DNA-binding NtrC family response regulator